jgi:hypothetical protein
MFGYFCWVVVFGAVACIMKWFDIRTTKAIKNANLLQ